MGMTYGLRYITVYVLHFGPDGRPDESQIPGGDALDTPSVPLPCPLTRETKVAVHSYFTLTLREFVLSDITDLVDGLFLLRWFRKKKKKKFGQKKKKKKKKKS